MDLRRACRNFIETDLQMLDLKHLAEFENIYRKRARLAIRLYKDWRKEYEDQTDSLELLYGSIEGILIRRQAEDAVRLYWIVRQDFQAAFKSYLGKISSKNLYPKAA